MAAIASFTFNDFQENTYVVYDDTKECVIVDPGCYRRDEKLALTDLLVQRGLTPVRLLNTHCHIDHILGNAYVAEKYKLPLEIHEQEKQVLRAAPVMGEMYGYIVEKVEKVEYIREGEPITFGNTTFEVFFTPGHSPGSISFYCAEDKFILSGDVLFEHSIGRTDLPGGNYETLMNSIRSKLMPLDDEVKVYSGHGPMTTIGTERKNNPFINNFV